MTPLTFTPLRLLPTGCGVCGDALRGIPLGCEQCGGPLHTGCYLTVVATAGEVETLMTTEQDVAILCRGCRS